MERVELIAASRTVRGKQVKQLRAESVIPAVLYGPDTPPKPIQIQQRLLEKALGQAGSTALINLVVDGEDKPYVVLARDIQHQILSGQVRHVDFYQVRLTEKVKTNPRLEFVGVCALADSGRAILIHAMNTVEIECLPDDLISTIEVDVSGLQRVEDSIVVADLSVPPGVTILASPDEVVVSLVPARTSLEAGEEGAAGGEEPGEGD